MTHATIGPAGGTLRTRAADGTVMTLTVPAGALATATALTISPARVRGLPFTGEFSVAAHFAPEGLRFARPARLTMKVKRKPKRRLVGFDAAGNGTGLGFARARVNGRTITKDVEHFSVNGAGSAAPQDILSFLQGIVESEFPLPVGQIELLREQIGVWVELFGADVCVELCSAVQEIVIASLVFHVNNACEDARAAPSLAGYERIAALDGMRSDFGGNEVIGDEYHSEVLHDDRQPRHPRGRCGSARDRRDRRAARGRHRAAARRPRARHVVRVARPPVRRRRRSSARTCCARASTRRRTPRGRG